MSVNIRPAAQSDAGFLAWVMLAASRGHVQRGVWDLVVGGSDQQCLDYLERLALAQPRSLCHYDNFLIAEADGRAAAALTIYKPADGGFATVGEAMSSVQRDLGWDDLVVAASRLRLGLALTCLPADAAADWSIEFVATLPEYRRRGLVDALMNEALRQGVERGCKLAQIMIFIGNDPAQAAYEKVGFQVHDESRSPEFEGAIGAPGFRRLLRKL